MPTRKAQGERAPDRADECHRDAVRQELRELDSARAARIQELQELADREVQRHDLGPAGSHPVLLVPSIVSSIAPLPASRYKAFRDHLERLIEELAEEDRDREPAPVPVPEVETEASALSCLLSSACRTCRGYCCRLGGDTAFLDLPTVRLYWQQHPERTSEQILHVYLEYLAEKTTEDHCVYQGSAGCTLPAPMRASICGDYFCEPLRDLKREFSEEADAQQTFVSMDRGIPRHAELADGKAQTSRNLDLQTFRDARPIPGWRDHP